MKNSIFVWVLVTTLALIIVTIMSVLNLPFNWIFYVTIIGQVLVIIMVYKVLTDNYETTKTFLDFYEDAPIGNRPNWKS